MSTCIRTFSPARSPPPLAGYVMVRLIVADYQEPIHRSTQTF